MSAIMKKVLASLFRLLCSLMVLLVVVVYLNAGNLHITPAELSFRAEDLLTPFRTVNPFSITAVVLVVLAALRLLDIIWNMAFCASLILVLGISSYTLVGETALPAALHGNETVAAFLSLPQSYPVPTLLIAAVFTIGWLAANAAFRIAFNTLLSYVLWFVCSFIFHAALGIWADHPQTAQGNAQSFLTFLLEHPWVCAALPGVFFMIYSLLMAFFDSFPSSETKDKPAPQPKPVKEQPAPAATEKPTPSKPLPAAPTPSKPLPVKPTPSRPLPVKPTPSRPLTLKKPTPVVLPKPQAVTKPSESKEEAPKPAEPAPVPAAEAPASKPETPVATAEAPAPKPETPASAAEAPAPKPETSAPAAEVPAPKAEESATENKPAAV